MPFHILHVDVLRKCLLIYFGSLASLAWHLRYVFHSMISIYMHTKYTHAFLPLINSASFILFIFLFMFILSSSVGEFYPLLFVKDRVHLSIYVDLCMLESSNHIFPPNIVCNVTTFLLFLENPMQETLVIYWELSWER